MRSRGNNKKTEGKGSMATRRIAFLLAMVLGLSMAVVTTGLAEDSSDMAVAAETQAMPDDVGQDVASSGEITEGQPLQAEAEAGEPEAVCYDVFFYDADGNEFGHVVAPEGAALAEPESEPTAPEGMAFAGWFEENAAEAYRFEGSAVVAELKLYARFGAAFKAAEGSKTIAEEPEPSEEAAKPGENEPAAADASALGSEALPAAIGETVIVTYMMDGKEYKSARIEKETLADLSAPDAERTEPFLGWYLEGENAPFGTTRLVENDITLHAKFSSTEVLVTYLDTDGSVLDVIEMAKGEIASPTSRQPKVAAGEKFLYWTLDGDAEYMFADQVDANMMLIPKIEGLGLAIFVTNGSEIEPQVDINGFFAMEPQAQPARMGYIFDGWYTDETYQAEFKFAEMPIYGTVLIYAKWLPGTANYFVNFWAEKVNTNAGDPRDEASHGDYDLLYTKDMTGGSVGQEIEYTQTDAQAEWASAGAEAKEILYYSTFEYSEKKEVSAFGDTVINVFYKRTAFTFNFDVQNAAKDSASYSQADTSKPLEAQIYVGGRPVGSTYSITVKLGQDVSAIWPDGLEITKFKGQDNKGTYHMTNWSGYYGNGAKTIALSYLTVGFSVAGQPVRQPFVYTAGFPKMTEITLYPRVIGNPYFETRYYYTEIGEDEYNALKAAAPDSVREWTTTNGTYGGKRYYKYARTGLTAAQTQSPVSGAVNWPGTAIDGYETIGTTSAYTCRTNQFQKVVADTERNTANDSNRYYKIEYYMPAKNFTLTLVMNNGGIENPGGRLGTANGGSTYTATVSYGEKLDDIMPTDAQIVRQNYKFDGWYTDAAFNVEYSSGTMPASGLTLYAKFSGTEVTVKYYDGAEVTENGYARGDIITAHDLAGTLYDGVQKGGLVPGKGYFKGWYYTIGTANRADVEFPLGIELTQDEYVLMASFTPVEYTVTFMEDQADGNYTSYTKQTVQSGNNNTLARSGNGTQALGDITGYTFLGWSTAQGSSVADFSAATRVLDDVTVYPVWKVNEYKVTYDAGTPAGATNVPAEAQHAYKSTVDVAGDPVLTGHIFRGWKSSEAGGIYSESGTSAFAMPANDVTLVAQWMEEAMVYANTYVITYDKNGGDTEASPAKQSVTEPSLTVGTLPKPPVREGHVFSGWNTDAAGKGSKFTAATEVVVDLTVYAQWTPLYYQLAFDLNGGAGVLPKTQSLEEGSKAEAVEDPAWLGHTFLGWNFEKDGSGAYWNFDTNVMPARDVVLYAQWELIPPVGGGNPTEPGGPAAPGTTTGTTADTPADTTPVDTPVEDAVQEAQPATATEVLEANGPSEVAEAASGGDSSQTIGDNPVPLFGEENTPVWALLNLILAIGGAALGVAMVVVGVVRRRRKNDEKQQETPADDEEGKKRKRTRLAWLIGSAVLAIAGVVAFILTEDMTNAMVWMDNWTPMMIIIAVAEVVCSVFSVKRRKKDGDKEDKEKATRNTLRGAQELG